MASVEAAKKIDEFNLEDYYLQRRNFGSAVYVHKKFLNIDKQKVVEPKITSKVNKEVNKKNNRDKGQQFDGLRNSNIIFKDDVTYKVLPSNDSVLDQTIKFAKKLIPLVIPPSRDKSPTQVYYTIKPTKISKKKYNKSQKYGKDNDDVRRSKTKIIETYKKTNKERISVKESITCSSNNTSNDINNQSLCCTISESSEKRKKLTVKHTDTQKCLISESFEALATELNGDKIKVHLMTDEDKNVFIDTLKIPILHAIEDCISEINGGDKKSERLVQDNNRKLDEIIDKLNKLEMKLDPYTKMISEKSRPNKTSTLEQLGHDLLEDINSDNELSREFVRGEVNTVVEYPNEMESKVEMLGCGEIPTVKSTKSVGVKANRCARMPARYCWTDSERKG